MDAAAWVVGVGSFLLGALWCAGSTVVDWTAWFLVLPGRKPGALAEAIAFRLDPVAPERRLGEPIQAVAADGVALAGLWHPADAFPGEGEYAAAESHAPRGTVLVLHGFAEDPSTLRVRLAALTRHGWDAAALDTRSYGRSGGGVGSFGTREAADVRAWVDALAASGKLGPGPLAFWGRSMGAGIALAAAADDPRVKVLVLEAPYVDLAEAVAVVVRRRRVPFPKAVTRLVLNRAKRLAGAPLSRPRPIDVAARTTVAVLVVHGASDGLIPPAAVRRFAAAFPNPVRRIEVPGARHNDLVELGGVGLLDEVARFLDGAVPAVRAACRLTAGDSGRT